MNVDKRIVSAVKKDFAKFDFTGLDEKCTDEAKTRMYLIEPLLGLIGYSRDPKDMLTEINAGWGQKNDKADIHKFIMQHCQKKYGNFQNIIVENMASIMRAFSSSLSSQALA